MREGRALFHRGVPEGRNPVLFNTVHLVDKVHVGRAFESGESSALLLGPLAPANADLQRYVPAGLQARHGLHLALDGQYFGPSTPYHDSDSTTGRLLHSPVESQRLFGLLLNAKGKPEGDPRFPTHWGPNLEAAVAILGHRHAARNRLEENAGSALLPAQLNFLKTVAEAVALVRVADAARATFAALEALLLVPETPRWRDAREACVVGALLRRLQTASDQGQALVALECACQLSRLFVLCPGALSYWLRGADHNGPADDGGRRSHGRASGVAASQPAPLEPPLPQEPAPSLLELRPRFELESFLRETEQEATRSRSVPAWQAAAIAAFWRADQLAEPRDVVPLPDELEVKASITVGSLRLGKFVSAADVREVPFRRYLTCLAAGPVTELSARDEGFCVAEAPLAPPLRATIARQRLARALGGALAAGNTRAGPLLSDAQLAELAALAAAEAEAAAAVSAAAAEAEAALGAQLLMERDGAILAAGVPAYGPDSEYEEGGGHG